MYDETHQIEIALITKCGLYTHGSLFGLLYLGVNIRNVLGLECYTGKRQMYD